MKVELLATKECNHLPILMEHLNHAGIKFNVRLAEDYPLYFKKHNILCSPSIIIDGKVVYRGMPTQEELYELLKGKNLDTTEKEPEMQSMSRRSTDRVS